MTADELKHLAHLVAVNPAAADAFFDAAYPDRPGLGVRVVTRAVPDVSFGSDMEASLIRLCAAAGLSCKLAGLQRKQRETTPSPHERLVPQDWVFVPASGERTDEPATQVISCLQVLKASLPPTGLDWLLCAVREQLVNLLLDFPALLHPRIIWNLFISIPMGGRRRPESLAFELAGLRLATLPTVDDASASRVQAFATEPVVLLGLTGGGRRATLSSDLGSPSTALASKPSKSDTLARYIGGQAHPQVRFLASLLRLDELRSRATGQPGMFNSDVAQRQLAPALCKAFGAAWLFVADKHCGQANGIPRVGYHRSLLATLRDSPSMNIARLTPRLALTARLLFDRMPRSGGSMAGQARRAPHLLRALVDVGAAATQADAARLVAHAMFPTWAAAGSELEAHQASQTSSVEVARDLLLELEEAGYGRAKARTRIESGHTPHELWLVASTMLCTEAAMAAVISNRPVLPAPIGLTHERHRRSI